MSAPQLLTTVRATRAALERRRSGGATVALVPTMGALHEGHLALVRRAQQLADTVIVSIFVNPLQFGAGEDLDTYPRTLDDDLASLAAEGVDFVFAPTAREMYPAGTSSTMITAGHVATLLEGATRPGHFDGMLTVVAKLFNIAQPDLAVFGQKDAQQVFLVQRMVSELNLSLDLEIVPTVRESDGLALSSRNRFLDADARHAALALSRALQAADAAASDGLVELLAEATASFGDHDGVELDYFVVVNPDSFLPIDEHHRGRAIALGAARVGETRLIDNALVTIG